MGMIEDYTSTLKYYTSEDGLQLAYSDDEGEGMPLVMIGGINRNGIDYKYLAPHLQGVRQIRVDLRGRGASDYAPWETYLTHQEAKDVVKLLDVLGIEKAAFLGTSRGGALAMELGSFAKDRVIGVCLNDIGAGMIPRGAGNQQSALGQIPPARTYAQAPPTARVTSPAGPTCRRVAGRTRSSSSTTRPRTVWRSPSTSTSSVPPKRCSLRPRLRVPPPSGTCGRGSSRSTASRSRWSAVRTPTSSTTRSPTG